MISLIKNSNGSVIYLKDEISVYNINEFKEKFFRALEEIAGNVVINLKSVEYMDSAGISVLLAGFRKISEEGHEYYLDDVSDDIIRVLKMAGIYDVFTRVSSIDTQQN